MCEVHSRPQDIMREATHFNEKTGRELSASLMKIRLQDGAVPSQLPNCPDY